MNFTNIPETAFTSYTIENITFNYSGPYATIGDPNGPSQGMQYVAPKWLTGHAGGTLTMTFAQPVFALGFGFALNGEPGTTITNAINISLIDQNSVLASSTTLDASSVSWTPEGRFDFNGANAIQSASVTFRSDFPFHAWDPMFGIDNVSYAITPIPEPSAYAMAAGAISLLYVVRVRRKLQALGSKPNMGQAEDVRL